MAGYTRSIQSHTHLVFYFIAINQHAHNIFSHYKASMEMLSECQSEENEGV